jgi:protein-S-isoprenylcysteine O-methyltransferase Ste14
MPPGRLLVSTPFRTFLACPLAVIAAEWLIQGGPPAIESAFLPLLVWGYLQYRLVGRYRAGRGGGGPGMENPPERLVTTGPFAWCRNPMYLGHLIFLLGLTLSFRSAVAAAIAAAAGFSFHFRVRRDEKRLAERFGQPYRDYTARVKRWIPGLF